MIDFTQFPSPCYIMEEELLRKNLCLIKSVADRAGVEIILAFKSFAMWRSFPIFREYIDHSTASSVYEARLAHCKTCDDLYQGMCRICGCYVELRAAMKKNRCPQVHPRWNRVKNDE